MNLFDYASKYPARPGHKKRATSKKAADEVAPKAPLLRDQCLDLLKRIYPRGMTADQVAKELGKDKLSIRPRLTELFAKGLVMDTGLTSVNDSGKNAVVWAAVKEKKHG